MRMAENAIESFNGRRRTVDERGCFAGLDSRSRGGSRARGKS